MSSIFSNLDLLMPKYECINERLFTPDEMRLVAPDVRIECSKYGISAVFAKVGGGECQIPISEREWGHIQAGDVLDISDLTYMTLQRADIEFNNPSDVLVRIGLRSSCPTPLSE